MRGKISHLNMFFVQFLASNMTYLDLLLTCMLMVRVDSLGEEVDILNFAESGAFGNHNQTV